MGKKKKELRDVIKEHKEELMAIPGVHSIGAGLTPLQTPRESRRKCVLVYTSAHKWPLGLPKELDGYPVAIRPSKPHRALPKTKPR